MVNILIIDDGDQASIERTRGKKIGDKYIGGYNNSVETYGRQYGLAVDITYATLENVRNHPELLRARDIILADFDDVREDDRNSPKVQGFLDALTGVINQNPTYKPNVMMFSGSFIGEIPKELSDLKMPPDIILPQVLAERNMITTNANSQARPFIQQAVKNIREKDSAKRINIPEGVAERYPMINKPNRPNTER